MTHYTNMDENGDLKTIKELAIDIQEYIDSNKHDVTKRDIQLKFSRYYIALIESALIYGMEFGIIVKSLAIKQTIYLSTKITNL